MKLAAAGGQPALRPLASYHHAELLLAVTLNAFYSTTATISTTALNASGSSFLQLSHTGLHIAWMQCPNLPGSGSLLS